MQHAEIHTLVGWVLVLFSVLYTFRRRITELPITFYVGALLWAIGVGFGMWHSIQSYPEMLRQFGFSGAIELPFYIWILIIAASVGIHQFLIYYSIHEFDASDGRRDTSTSGFVNWVGTGLERKVRFAVLLLLLGVGGEVPHRLDQLYEMFIAPVNSHHLSTPTAVAIAGPATTACAPTTTFPATNVPTRNKDYMLWSIFLFLGLLSWDIGAFAVANRGQIMTGFRSDVRILFTTHYGAWDARQCFIVSDLFALLFFVIVYLGLNAVAPGLLVLVLLLSGTRYIYIIARRMNTYSDDVSTSATITTK